MVFLRHPALLKGLSKKTLAQISWVMLLSGDTQSLCVL